MLLTLVLAGTMAAGGGGGDRADEVVARMREALRAGGGGEAVRSLGLEADVRRLMPVEGAEPRDMSGELTVDVLLPDRYLKVETLSAFPGAPAVSIGTGFDGQEAWRAPVGVPPGHGMVIRVQTPDEPGAATSLRRRTRAELTRLALLSLGVPPAGAGLSFRYVGEAEAPEGRAHVLDVSGAEGFAAQLFVDVKTHLPLMLTFKGQVPVMRTVRAKGPAEMERARAEAERTARAAAEAPETEVRLFVSDYREVGGLRLPHRFLQEMDAGAREEWTVKKWKVNPALQASAFRKQG
ncbi:MAG TPA: hypothetical protein VFO85_21165 [Vicinamibacteria bacterium]|nr:hypothetical protein [Vicinamibacteria bacterium]